MTYPKAAIVLAVVSLLVGAQNVSGTDYAADEGAAQIIDFVFAAGITFAFWYGVVLVVGWLVRRARRPS